MTATTATGRSSAGDPARNRAAREAILGRIRGALRDVPAEVSAAEDTPIPWTYAQPTGVEDVLEYFVDRIIDYKAAIDRVAPDAVGAAVAAALQQHEVRSVVVPRDLDDAWVRAAQDAGIEVRRDGDPRPLTHTELDVVGGVVTTCAVAAAESGTIILDHSQGQGRRALSLVPDVHVCVVRADQVVTDIPEAVARVTAALRAGQPQTWISGGSATSDIELSRVEGVHGPRTLHVILVEP